ncbi:MAG: arsenite methyltransferase [Vulcanimicrobiaceae bacterium]
MSASDIKEVVKGKYGQAALRVKDGASASCGTSRGAASCCNPITSDLYDFSETREIPEGAMLASLGCGNPTALAKLNPGEVVLDLGSGGGIDVLLSARRVGPAGKAYGLDMTDEMLALANENKRQAAVENVEFLKGEIEHIPLPDNSVGVIISNCVINLSADKDQVLREAYRVLKPGGRFAVSDVVTRGEIDPAIRQSVLLWVGCVAGALEDVAYRDKLASAGFENIDIEPTRVYRAEDAGDFLSAEGIDVDAMAVQVDGKFMSAFVRAVKPAGATTTSRSESVLLKQSVFEGTTMTTTPIQVFDPALCCSTGVCGVDVGEEKVTFAADVEWLKGEGGQSLR